MWKRLDPQHSFYLLALPQRLTQKERLNWSLGVTGLLALRVGGVVVGKWSPKIKDDISQILW